MNNHDKDDLATIVVIHGIIHFVGFLKAFQLAEIKQIAQEIPRPIGFLWFISALLFIVMAAIFLLNNDWWRMLAVPALGLSQVLLIRHWPETK